ncbi:MAG: 3-deoxy-manno-octulosonate cytidylyltransferase [bacterium]|nr:3-deoxy-manno-octulosonate cytidylyltransferase [bacterium]MDD5354283.1 3-deoxy-manno-octulosonate cytidylyltransferase [bacterium]MDD5755729.1 3-deoxy-manno-octulosonate cytidylyltransferase [bacterium]
MMRIVGVIPARLKSTRLPEKPLQMIQGKYLVQRVYEQAKKAHHLNDVIIACDHEKIASACSQAGAKVVLTSLDCSSGTDRVAEIARKTKADVFLNIQGDEPLIDPRTIDQVALLFRDKNVIMGTAVIPLKEKQDIQDPNVVKAVLDKQLNVLYFSRSPLPYQRNIVKGLVYYKHLGLYGFHREFLLKFASLPQTILEKTESLEQLRALENGFKIRAVITRYDSIGVDTVQDLKKVCTIIRRMR